MAGLVRSDPGSGNEVAGADEGVMLGRIKRAPAMVELTSPISERNTSECAERQDMMIQVAEESLDCGGIVEPGDGWEVKTVM